METEGRSTKKYSDVPRPKSRLVGRNTSLFGSDRSSPFATARKETGPFWHLRKEKTRDSVCYAFPLRCIRASCKGPDSRRGDVLPYLPSQSRWDSPGEHHKRDRRVYPLVLFLIPLRFPILV